MRSGGAALRGGASRHHGALTSPSVSRAPGAGAEPAKRCAARFPPLCPGASPRGPVPDSSENALPAKLTRNPQEINMYGLKKSCERAYTLGENTGDLCQTASAIVRHSCQTETRARSGRFQACGSAGVRRTE